MTTYACSLLRSTTGNFQSLLPQLSEVINDKTNLWGRFAGLFGLRSDELIVVTYGNVESIDDRFNALESVASSASLVLTPTARPTSDTTLDVEGLYVFRTFDVNHDDVEEIARLSAEAWTTFEVTDAYDAQPQALFCQADRSAERGTMLLVTRYDGLHSWVASRTPAPAASENFRKRAQLTRSTRATATRLITT